MSVIIRLQNLPLTASSLDIRNFFHGLGIPDGGVHIVGGPEGDAFIAFSTDEDARQAMRLTGSHLKDSRVSLLLSSRNEMYKVIEQARCSAMSGGAGASPAQPSSHHQSSLSSSANNLHYNTHLGSGDDSPRHHLSPQVSSSSSNNLHSSNNSRHHQSANNSVTSSMSPTSTANDYLRNLTGGSGGSGAQADLSSNPALLFSTMAAIPSASLGASPNAYLHHQQQQSHHHGFGSIGSSQSQQHQQNQAAPNNHIVNTSVAPPSSVFPNGNPFLIPPPNVSNLTLPFHGLLNNTAVNGALNNTNAAASGPNSTAINSLAGQGQNGPGTGAMGLPPSTTGVLGFASNFLNSTMSMAGGTNSLNPFGNPPPRMGMLNAGALGGSNGGANTGSAAAAVAAFSGLHGGPRFGLGNNVAGGGMLNVHGNHQTFGAGVGATPGPGMGGNRHQQNFGGPGTRVPFGNHGGNADINNRFQLGAIPSGRMDPMNGRDMSGRDIKPRGRSPPSRDDRRGGGIGGDPMGNRRRRSRDRDRFGGNDRRRRRSRSRSKSRSSSRDRSVVGGSKPSRRDSRDKRDSERRSRSDSSPEKSSQESLNSKRGRNEVHEPSPTPTSANTTTEEWPGVKLTGIPSDASYREIKEFIRADVMGGSDGVVRLYEEGMAFLKLEKASDFPRVFRSIGRKLRGSTVNIEGITMETWTQEYKLNKSRLERDIDREREEREKERGESRRDSDRNRDHGGGRDRDGRHRGTESSQPLSSQTQTAAGQPQHHHQRSSRFSNASNQSSCIAIRGLAPTVTRQELVSKYLRDTPCLDVVLIAAPTPNNRHSVTAFVQFESFLIAQTVINGIVRSPLSTTLVVESCDIEDLQQAKLRTGGVVSLGGGLGLGLGNNKTGLSSMNHIGMVQDAKSIFELDLGLDDETTTIIMKGAPPNISERDVFDFFSDIGLAPMNVRILHDTDGQCSGQVICEFQDNNKAKRATTKDGMLFGRGQISISLLPSRNSNTKSGIGSAPPSGEYGLAQLQQSLQQNNSFVQRNQNQRPGLLGPAPPRGGGQGSGGGMQSRFSSPTTTSSPNIFEQALQQQSGPTTVTRSSNMGGGDGGGGRGRGGLNSRGRGERMSRFSNNDNRPDFRNQNGIMGRGGGRGGSHNSSSNNSNKTDLVITDDDMALFNKTGCVIGLENIPYKSSMDDILQYLEEILKIRISPDRIIRRYDDMQKPTGDARVAFDTEFEAKLACDRLRGTYMWKRLISAAVIE